MHAPRKIKKEFDSGRTLMETMATLAIVGVLSVGAVKLYNYTTTGVKAQNTAKMIKTLALERQNFAMKATTGGRTRVKGPHSDIYVENGVAGKYSKYFWVETSLSDSAFCDALKESDLIQADLIEVNDMIDGACSDNAKLAFYFKKNPSTDETLTWVDEYGQVQKCPKGSATCDSSGNATSCESGYYLVDGTCDQCGTHVATCEDENTPISCQEGYELHWGQCITPPQMCTMDSDCDICATCDTETGYCQGECEVPTQRCYKNVDCGTNECIICDTATQTCQNACIRVEYLESTGTQYIDTGILSKQSLKIKTKIDNTKATASEFAYGVRKDTATITCATGWYSVGGQRLGYFRWGTSAYSASCPYGVSEIEQDSSGVMVNGDFYTYGEAQTVTSQTGYTITLFAGRNSTTGVTNNLNGKIFYLKLWDDGTLVRDFIPVHAPFHPVDKQNCMFDRATKKLFCNQGTEEDFKTNLDD